MQGGWRWGGGELSRSSVEMETLGKYMRAGKGCLVVLEGSSCSQGGKRTRGEDLHRVLLRTGFHDEV